ncbi:MAG: DMT family transporter [Coleofasciculus sp. G3-WIS-01]|uniref:DMT family transporter n=1 Tax=Coleofasciculus sp. G3-WIS-01 TaxID=3069528 RepID=UPI0032F6CD1C
MIQKTQQLQLSQSPINPSPTMMALFAIFTAIVALSLAAIFIRLSERELGPFATIFNRFWIAFLVLWLLNQSKARSQGHEKLSGPQSTYTVRDWLMLLSAGVMFWGCLALWAWSLTQTGVANSTILHNLTPLFTTLGVWLIFGQRFDSQFLIGLMMAMVGATALGLDDLQVATDNFAGDIAAFLSALFSAANLMLIEKLRAKWDATTIIMWCCLVGLVVTFPVVLLTEDRLFPISGSGWLSVIGLAIVCQVVGQGLQAYSLKRLSSGLVGVFLLLDPVLAAMVAWVLFSEHLSLFNGFAFAVVLLGIYVAKSSQYASQVMANDSQPALCVAAGKQLPHLPQITP